MPLTNQSSVLKLNAHLGGQQLAPALSRKRRKRKTTASSNQLDVHVGRKHANRVLQKLLERNSSKCPDNSQQRDAFDAGAWDLRIDRLCPLRESKCHTNPIYLLNRQVDFAFFISSLKSGCKCLTCWCLTWRSTLSTWLWSHTSSNSQASNLTSTVELRASKLCPKLSTPTASMPLKVISATND